MQEHYSVRRGVGTHPAADDGFAPKLPVLPAAPERDGDRRAVHAMRNRLPVVPASASPATRAGARVATAVETGEGADAFLPPVTVRTCTNPATPFGGRPTGAASGLVAVDARAESATSATAWLERRPGTVLNKLRHAVVEAIEAHAPGLLLGGANHA